MRNFAIVAAVSAALGASAVKYYWPTVQTKVEIQQKEVIKNDVRTIVRTVERPDGTKETTQEILDRSVRTEDKRSTAMTFKKADWHVSVLARSSLRQLTPVYGTQLEKRILGPVFAGVAADTDGKLGIVVGLEF